MKVACWANLDTVAWARPLPLTTTLFAVASSLRFILSGGAWIDGLGTYDESGNINWGPSLYIMLYVITVNWTVGCFGFALVS